MRLGILTDIHHCPPGSPADGWHNQHQFATVLQRLGESIAWLEAQGVDRIAILGDLTHFGDEDSMQEVIATIGQAQVPVWVLPGNHDLKPDTAVLAAAITASGHDAIALLNGAAEVAEGDWWVTGLDLARADSGGYLAPHAPDPAAWGNAPVLVLSHFPVLSIHGHATGAGLKYAGDLVNGARIAESLLARTAPTLVINGHLHIRHAITEGPVLQASCGAQVESLFEATIVDFGAWHEGRISWLSFPVQAVDPGVNPALSEPTQVSAWTGTAWTNA